MTNSTQTVHLIAAARPNFMKVAPLWHVLSQSADFEPVLIHTGQHYDANMSDAIFADLGLPAPDHHLGVGSGTHAEQTGKVMIAYEAVAMAERPDWLIVVGDVNSTLAGALVGTKLGIPTVHLEAGLRSGDRTMPEEINRLATDAIADILWTPSPDADANLLGEGVVPARITRVGNIMLDSFERVRPALGRSARAASLASHDRFGVVTLHRPGNVDDPEMLDALMTALIEASRTLPLVFPVHPRTRDRLEASGWDARLRSAAITLVEPLAYLDFMALVTRAAAIITDSGGLQEETTYLGISCLTLRPNTERPITITQGTNQLVTANTLTKALKQALRQDDQARPRPEFWDGATAHRCIADLRRRRDASTSQAHA